MKWLLFVMLLIPTTSNAQDISNAQLAEYANLYKLCTVKLNVVGWAITNVDTIPRDDMIEQWTSYYNLFHQSSSSIFTQTTQVDVERIIRDVHRMKDKFGDGKYKDGFLAFEAEWCTFYQH